MSPWYIYAHEYIAVFNREADKKQLGKILEKLCVKSFTTLKVGLILA